MGEKCGYVLLVVLVLVMVMVLLYVMLCYALNRIEMVPHSHRMEWNGMEWNDAEPQASIHSSPAFGGALLSLSPTPSLFTIRS
jgi:hypothetical protein